MSNYCTCHLNEKCEWCRLKDENKRYREALEFYADKKSYSKGMLPQAVLLDRGMVAEKALQALRGETDECT